MNDVADSGIRLGSAPRPRDDAELTKRVLAALRGGFGELTIADLDDDAVSVRLDGSDIQELSVRATGARVSFRADETEGSAFDDEEIHDAIAEVERGMLREAQLNAHPLTVLDAPVEVDAHVWGVPIEWITRDSGALELYDGDAADAHPRADIRVRVSHEAVTSLATNAVYLATAGSETVSFDDVEVAVTDAGADAVALSGAGMLGYGRMHARVRLAATLRVIDGERIRVDGLELSSPNLLVKLLIASVRSKIAEAVADDIDLVQVLGLPFDGDVRVSLGADIDGVRVELRVG